MSVEKKDQTDRLSSENDSLRAELATLRDRVNACRQSNAGATLAQTLPESYLTLSPDSDDGSASIQSDLHAHLSIVVLGASGDLATKKTYPALFALYRQNLLPASFTIVGYARSNIADDEFKKKISSKFGGQYTSQMKDAFLAHCWYVHGQYDSSADFGRLASELLKVELKDVAATPEYDAKKVPALNRIFYMALPPTAFVPAAKSISAAALTKLGWNRVVVEKPFGHDSASSQELGRELGALFEEDELYRIDHYLGKEMVQNLMVLRFANKVFEPLWNRDHISCVQITFKEDFGTQGRAGFFDSFGIIRDVMQNHLLQMLSIVAMEPPLTLSAEDVRDEKVKLLRSIGPITPIDTVIGQYTADPKGKEHGYTDDPEVPKDSVTPTFAVCALHINNSRWMGIPFILKCGKALNEKKAEIRIQFKQPVNTLFSDISPNELVLRVGPDEAVYLKMTTKEPGLDGGNRHTDMDLTYKDRFHEAMKDMPDAYMCLIRDVIRGDHNLFVRSDELAAAWRIFTPLLHAIESEKVLSPIKYAYGSRGPKEADALIARYGYVVTDKYKWEQEKDQVCSPSPSCVAETILKHEPIVLAPFIRLIESSSTDVRAFVSLFTPDATIDTPTNGPKPVHDFYTAFLPTQSGRKATLVHKFVDPSQPHCAAMLFAGQAEVNGKIVQMQSMNVLKLTDDWKQIKQLTVFNEGTKQAKL